MDTSESNRKFLGKDQFARAGKHGQRKENVLEKTLKIGDLSFFC